MLVGISRSRFTDTICGRLGSDLVLLHVTNHSACGMVSAHGRFLKRDGKLTTIDKAKLARKEVVKEGAGQRDSGFIHATINQRGK